MELFALIAAFNWKPLLFMPAGAIALVIVWGLWWVLTRKFGFTKDADKRKTCNWCMYPRVAMNVKFCPHCGHEMDKDEDNGGKE